VEKIGRIRKVDQILLSSVEGAEKNAVRVRRVRRKDGEK
jgi:hypothetical protein